MLAIRPFLPDIDNSELESIIELTKNFVIGYYSGPLYFKQDKINVLLPGFKSKEEKKPHWMLEGNTYQELTKVVKWSILSHWLKSQVSSSLKVQQRG